MEMSALGRIQPYFQTEMTFVTSCLLFCAPRLIGIWVFSKIEEFTPWEHILSFKHGSFFTMGDGTILGFV